MIRGTKPVRNSRAEIIKPAEFQNTKCKMGRIHPDRKWFRASKTVSQIDLEKFRETSKIETPYNVLLRTGSVPYSLLTENSKKKSIIDFDSVFGKNAIRKKPKLYFNNLSELKNIKEEIKEKIEIKNDSVKGQSSRIWKESYKV